ncbi:hypothetical protein A2996_01110, partial [Candidatus Campbellbacteria bacterium RIFCSPLOWO2_01_FULL_34_15]
MQNKSIKSYLIFGLLLFLFASPINAEEQNRSYLYDSFKVDIVINKDSTLDITERQTFNYKGRYNKGWRSIPLNKVSAITDVKVIDGATGLELIHSSKILEKTDPDSWGKYTFYKQNGAINIEWYYDLADTSHEWIIEYKVYGGIGFYNDHDEVYWNLFTDFDVPINHLEVLITLPANNFSEDDITETFYSDAGGQYYLKKMEGSGVFYSKENIPAKADVTVAVGWPKGLINQSSFWLGWIKINILLIVSSLIIFLCLIIGFVYWYRSERMNQGRGTIIPQYEPPQNLRPAMAEIICREGITPKAWPATIVDLAVRGYITIKDNTKKFLIFKTPDFVLEKKKNFLNEDGLEDYEREYLTILFSYGKEGKFSTREMNKSSDTIKRDMYKKIKKLEEHLIKETEIDTGAFEKLLSKEKKMFRWIIFLIVFIAFSAEYSIYLVTEHLLSTSLFLVISAVIILIFFIKYEARLNKKGQILKEDWLGFKIFLETTGKDRMQNLTPEIFEKYLPYAMIFEIEKQWAKKFEGVHMAPPVWYHSTGAMIASSSSLDNSASNFSPSAFSSSFSSAFSSAFSSSAGGGGAGGGGG